MGRLNRAETQERNRARVLLAARAEFAERGFRDAKVDVIAERAELTRGAVYSNFPGKRALYLAVLAKDAETASQPPLARPGHTVEAALGQFARAWLARLDSADDWVPSGAALLPEILADEPIRLPFAQLTGLTGLLLALAMENLRPTDDRPGPQARLNRVAGTVLTTLHGARQLAAAAPGFIEPFDVISAAERLAGLALNDHWAPPAAVPPVRAADLPWAPPFAVDAVTGVPVDLTGDGVLVVLGLHRLAAAEQAVRAGAGPVTAVLVTGEPAEYGPLARLVLAEVAGCLRSAFPRAALPRLRVVYDESGRLAGAAGVAAVSDGTEVAVRIAGGRVVAGAEGPGAAHAIARTAATTRPASATPRSGRR